MFRGQQGLRSISFVANGSDRAVVTLRADATVAASPHVGVPRRDSTVEMFEVEDRFPREGGSL